MRGKTRQGGGEEAEGVDLGSQGAIACVVQGKGRRCGEWVLHRFTIARYGGAMLRGVGRGGAVVGRGALGVGYHEHGKHRC